MKNRFLKTCSICLILILIFNMLPHQALAEMLSTEDLGITSGDTVTTAPLETADLEVVEEVTDKRTEYTKEFRLNNGLHLAAVYNSPVHFEENGQWKEIDNTLVSSITRGSAVYINKAGALRVTFPQQLTANQYVTVTKDGYTLQFGMGGVLSDSGFAVMSAGNTFSVQQANTSAAQVQRTDISAILAQAEHPQMVVSKLGSRLQYSNVYSNTNVVYDLQSNTLKESVIISRFDSTLRGYRYTLNVGNMVPVLQEDNSIWFYGSGREEVVMVMPAPFLVDAAKEYNHDVKVTMQGSGSTYTLQYILPTQWLAAEERAWPVVLDPDITADIRTSNVRDVSVGENQSFGYTEPTIQCGYGPNWGRYRFLIKYTEIPPISSSDVIVKAQMRLYKPENSSTAIPVEVHKVNTTWNSESVTWADSLDFNETIEDFAMVSAAGDYYWDVTGIVREWYEDANTGMLFKVPTAREDVQNPGMVQFYSSDYSDYSTYMPTLTVYFRNNNGLESYWDYSSATAGRAGTGYVNNYTGNLVWVHGDIGFGGNLMPVSISHVYNASDSHNNEFGMGYGWRTNFNQKVRRWDQDSTYYIWEDSDGTKHYFKYYEEDAVYKDEDGLELTLTTTGSGDNKFCIEDKNGNKSFFNTDGYLTKQQNNQATPSSITITYTNNRISQIMDGANRKYYFTYTGNFLTKIAYKAKGTLEISYVTFDYENGDLTEITDKDGEYVTYDYDAHRLITATDIDGYRLEYTYRIPTAPPNSEGIIWQPYRVVSVAEFDGTAEGGVLTFAYAHNQTTVTDYNGNKQIFQFNNWGNTISVQDGEGHAQFAQYAQDTDPVNGKGNQLTVSSKLQNTVANLLPNNSFEQTSTWSGVNATVTNATGVARYGNKSMKITSTSSGYAQTTFVAEAKKTYTFSAFVKTDSSVAYLKMGDNVCANLAANSDWTRLQVSYTNPTSTSRAVTVQVVNAAGGTTYVDCVQLEEAHTASRYNLVTNGDFRTTDSWSSAGTITTSSDSGAPQLSDNAYKLSGTYTGTYRTYQTIQIGNGKGKAGDCFILAGWGKGNTVPYTIFTGSQYNPGTRAFCLQMKFVYTDGTESVDFSVSFNPAVDNWQYAAAPMMAEKDYSSIKIYLSYINGAGEVWFDGIQLYKERFGNFYNYDDDTGNLVEMIDANGGTTTYIHDNKNDLRTVEGPDGTDTNYVYDTYHNLTQMTTNTGVVYECAYDEYGNNLSVSVTSGGITIYTSAEYTDDGNRMVSSTDAAGNKTTYSYNANTNVLDWVKYPNDDDNTKTTYTYDSMYRLARSAANNDGKVLSAEYAYADDLLTSITTGSTVYNFTYGDFGLRSAVKVGTTTLASYSYTSRNNYLETLAYGNGDSVKYTYDSKGRLIEETYKDGTQITGSVAYTYDNDGSLATVTDSATGIKTTYYYDLQGRLAQYVVSDSGYTHTVTYAYDPLGNVAEVRDELYNNTTQVTTTKTTGYEYDQYSRLTKVTNGNASKSYDYDSFGRVYEKITRHGSTTVSTENITYETANGKTNGRVTELENAAGTFGYTYDANGNILSIIFGGKTTTYTYDSQNQLTRENNQAGGYTYTWEYDNAGNIVNRKEYAYTTGTLGSVVDTVTYGYGNTNWRDLLTSYDGQTITYDTIGNPLSYYNGNRWTFTWQNGRELATMTKAGVTWTNTYDANGMRTRRTNGITYYEYVYDGSTLSQMRFGANVLDFIYGAEGTPLAVIYGGSYYYYVTNAHGDVVALLNSSGNTVVSYTYDAWGNILSVSGSMAAYLGGVNPLRYRGYVYDNETGFYYLQSRYYDPTTGRFLNADAFASTGQGLLGNNMFVYCLNNPVGNSDESGYYTDGQIHDFVIEDIVDLAGLQGRELRYRRWDTLIIYDIPWRGRWFGFCDIYDAKTGEMWEVKKASGSYTCSTTYASHQLNNYIYNGTLVADPDLKRQHPYSMILKGLSILQTTFSKYDMWGNEYVISYWEEGGGIIRYSYFVKISQKNVNALAAAIACAGIACGMSFLISYHSFDDWAMY